MAGTELIIDDDYVNEMADFLNTRATNLQEGIDRYIQILENIRRDAIKQGATADALLFDDNLELTDVFAKGRQMMRNREIIVRGTFEE